MKSQLLDNLKKFLESEEGQKQTQEFFAKINQKETIVDLQLERAHKKINDRFEEVLLKVIAKYDSDKYKDHWYSRQHEPPDSLFYFFFEYAKKYGRELTSEERKIHSNPFTHEIYQVNNYIFNLMLGQGSAILVTKNKLK